MALARKEIGTQWSGDNRNAMNENFKELYEAPDRIKGIADEAVLRSNEAIDTANTATTTANDAETKADSVQEQFNQVVIEGDSSVEAAQARVTADGTSFTTLQERLNSSDANLAQSSNDLKGDWSVWEEFDQRGINVKWFGAVADANYYDKTTQQYYTDASMTIPATDNQPAFQAAVDFMSNKGGGTVFAPRGNYGFKSGVKWMPRVSLIGDGIGSTILLGEGRLFSLIFNLDGLTNGTQPPEYGYLEYCRFEGFEIDMKGLTYPYSHTDGKCMFMLYMKKSRFHNIALKNSIGTSLGCDFLIDTVISNVYTDGAGRNWGIPNETGYVYPSGQSGIGIGTSAEESEPLVISNCHTYNSGYYGIFVETQGGGVKTKNAKIIGCHAEGNLHGFSNRGSGDTQFIGCSAFRNLKDGFEFRYGARHDQMVGCFAEENGEYGVHVWSEYFGHLQLDAVKANNNAKDGIYIESKSGGLKNITITNIHALGNGVAGVRAMGGLKNFILSDSTLSDNGKDTTVNEFYRSGLVLSGANDGVNILNNIITDDQTVKTQLYGIRLSDQTTNYVLTGNNARGHEKGQIILLGDIKANGKIGENVGFESVMTGEGSFADGDRIAVINHYFGVVPSFVTLIPKGSQNIWVSSSGANQMQVYKETTSGALDFTWKIEI